VLGAPASNAVEARGTARIVVNFIGLACRVSLIPPAAFDRSRISTRDGAHSSGRGVWIRERATMRRRRCHSDATRSLDALTDEQCRPSSSFHCCRARLGFA